MMDFIKEYHFMAEGVQPVTPFPLAISTQSRYSSVTVELNKDLGIAMLYIGALLNVLCCQRVFYII